MKIVPVFALLLVAIAIGCGSNQPATSDAANSGDSGGSGLTPAAVATVTRTATPQAAATPRPTSAPSPTTTPEPVAGAETAIADDGRDRTQDEPVDSGSQTPEAEATPGQIGDLHPDMGHEHIPAGERGVYPVGISPPTSGPHWGVFAPTAEIPTGSPARWGLYNGEIPNEVLVHNLEHGGIGMHYNCPETCSEVIQTFISIAQELTGGASQFIISPYSGMDSNIAITAWNRVLFLDEIDVDLIASFVTAYRDKALESVPGNLF